MPKVSPGDWVRRATSNPLIRGGLMIGFGIALGNVIGFVRVALTAYLLGTHSLADALAVAVGPIDTINGALINTMIFALVPMLTLRQGHRRVALLRRAGKLFGILFVSLSTLIFLFSPLLIRALGPGLAPEYVPVAVNILRITSISTLAAGTAALYSALLFTERRFGPTAFYQASLNLFTIIGALLFWRMLNIYAFAIGYAIGSGVQLAVVYTAARRSWRDLLAQEKLEPEYEESTRELLWKPACFLAYASLLALNLLVTRSFATQAGSGMAAAFDYCIRLVSVVIAYLVSPLSNSLLPEIARLRSEQKGPEAVRLTERTIALAGAAAVISLILGVLVREPAIALLFQRGNFTAESTRMVSGVFIGFAPSMIGMSLLELMSRSLFAMDRPKVPLIVSFIPVLVNLAVCALLHAFWPARAVQPEFIALGASAGLLLGFVVLLILTHRLRKGFHAVEPVQLVPST